MSQQETHDVEVRFEDQQNINTFNKLNQRMHELDSEIKAQQTSVEDLDDAENELMLLDEEEQVQYVVGESFFHISVEEAQDRISTDITKTKAAKALKEKELAAVKAEMAQLKKVLYAKFGNAINLEE